MSKKSDAKRNWVIEGFDSTRLIFRYSVPLAALTQRQAEEVIRFLVAKHGLSDDEIVGCLVKKNSLLRMEHLEVQRSSIPTFSISCGSNPYVIARVQPIMAELTNI